MITRTQALSWLASINVNAFLRVVRAGESWNDRDDIARDELAFRVRYGGWDKDTRKHRPPAYFTSFDDHPRVYEPTPTGDVSSAAGAFQITATTWDDLRRQFPWLGPSFKPFEQLLAGALLIYRRGALDDVIDGRLEEAVAKCGREWASLPGSPLEDGGSKVAWERVRAVWREWGGGVPSIVEITPDDAPVPAPIEDRSTQARPEDVARIEAAERAAVVRVQPKEATVAPAAFLIPLLQGLFQLFSPVLQGKLAGLFGKVTDDKPAADTMAQQMLALLRQVAEQNGVPLTPPPQPGVPALPAPSPIVEAAAIVEAIKTRPALVAKAEAQVEDWLAKVSPMVDKLAEIERAAWEASEASMDRAAARGGNNDDWMALALIGGMLAMAGVLILFILGIAVAQVWQSGTPSTEVWAAVTGLIGSVFGIAGGVFAYRFGTTRQSTAKDITSAALAGELSRRTAR